MTLCYPIMLVIRTTTLRHDDLTNGDYEKKPKENYADTFRKALEENDSSSDEETQRDDAVKKSRVCKRPKALPKKRKLSQERRKSKIDRGAERREKERKRIAKENLILQKRMQSPNKWIWYPI